jgi:DNA-binding beta-propeller fold protein YncE
MTPKYLAVSLAICVAASVPLIAQDAPPLRTVRSIPLPAAVKGAFDHLTVDLAHHRLFVTPEDYKAVMVLDLATGAVIHEITGIGRPHAVLYREDLNRIYVTDGEEGAVKTFDGATYRLLKTTALAKDADSIGYDSSRKLLYVDNGGKDEGKKYSLVSIIETGSDKKLADITIESETLEAMALDVFRPRMYVNNKAKNQIEVIDRWKGAVVAVWPVTLCKDNVAMGLDEQHQRLFAACRDGKVSVFDTNTGKELQALSITTGVDDLVYDAGTKRIYAAGNGAVSILEQTDADHYRGLGTVPTGPGGKTALLVASLNRYFVAIPQQGSQNASILEMEPAGVKAALSPDPVVSIAVDAPAAEQLILTTMSAHPYLRKMGLHAIPEGAKDSVIIANANANRIGVKSSDGDLDAVKDGKTYCVKRDDGAFYNVKMPLYNAARRAIGILVMEIPYTSAKDEADAVRQAEDLRTELARQIPGHSALFQYSLNISAPYGQKLVDDAMAAHPGVQKMGLHVNAPHSQENVIIANNIPSKIGKKSSDGDMSVVRTGKPTVNKVTGVAPFYDLALPLSDAAGKSVGMIVMEIRAQAAKDEADALRQGEDITKAIEGSIPNEAALFGERH